LNAELTELVQEKQKVDGDIERLNKKIGSEGDKRGGSQSKAEKDMVRALEKSRGLIDKIAAIRKELAGYDIDLYYKIDSGELEAVNARFNEELETLTPENANSKVFNLGKPSEKLLAAGIPNNPFNLYGNKLIKKAQKHGFNISDIKDLPKAMANPIAVFEGNHKDSFVILTELDINGNKVIASVETNKKGEIDINLISSVYGKSDKGIIEWINNGRLKWVDKEKTLSYLSAPALNAGATNNTRFPNAAAKVIQEFENPKLSEINNTPRPVREDYDTAIEYWQAMAAWNREQRMQPIKDRAVYNEFVDLLKQSGLADNVYGHEKLREFLEKHLGKDGVEQFMILWHGGELNEGDYEKISFMHTRRGEVMGMAVGRDIYLDDTKMNANTPIHEFTHPWLRFVKEHNRPLWDKIIELSEQSN
jgi:hypothetical protein